MTSGGMDFQAGDDYVAARLNIDVDAQAISTLRELTQEIERYQVRAESAARTQDDFNQQLRMTTEAAEQATRALQNVMSNMAVATHSGAPGRYENPWAGVEAGMGRAPASVGEAQTQIDGLRQTDPRTYLNAQAQRGNMRSGDIPAGSPGEQQLSEAANRVHQREQVNAQRQQETSGGGDWRQGLSNGAGIAGQIMNEIGPGGSFHGMAGAIGRGLSAAAPGGLEGGALGMLRGGAGVVGGGLAAWLAGYGLFQKGGEIMQGYANMGSVRGGGAAEGLSQELAVRSMAMNPFLSTEQSRAIIQSALTDGYTGKSFDMATNFMAENLKSMNLDVASSVELLRKNVNEGGQSIVGLAANLGVLKEMSKTGSRSLPELQAGFSATSGTLMQAGFAGPEAERAAMLAAGSMSGENDQAVKGVPERIVQAMSSDRGMAFMRAQGGLQIPAGVAPGAMPFLMSGEQQHAASLKVVGDWAKRLHAQAGSPAQGSPAYAQTLLRFHTVLQSIGVPMSKEEAKNYFNKIVYEGRDPVGEGTQKTDAATQEQASVDERSPLSQFGGGFTSFLASQGNAVTGAVSTIAGSVADAFTGNAGNIPDRWKNLAGQSGQRGAAADRAASRYSISMLDQIEKLSGPNGMEVLDQNQNAVELDRNNREMMEALSSGKYTWRPKGSQGRGVALTETPQGGDNFRERVTEVQGTLRIEMDPSAERAGVRVPGTIKLTPHEIRANQGYGDATPNNAAPGEGAISRGRTGW